METIVDVQHVSKSYHQRKAVDDVSFRIQRGEILCLLGPNGAGKTTTIHMIAALLKSDSGDIHYLGQSIQQNQRGFQKQLGFVPQNLALYEELSAIENLRFFAGLYGLKKEREQFVQEALAFSGLADRAHDPVKSYSTGMKRRLNIACGIVHHPHIAIMDEPTVGIDPQSRNYILQSIQELKKQGMTILYTTHYMEEVEELADRILIMDHGHIIAQGNKEALKESMDQQRQYILEVGHLDDFDQDAFYRIEGVQKILLKEHTLAITTMKQVENLDHIIRCAVNQHLQIQNVAMQTTTLETVFLSLTGRSLRD